MEALRFRDWCLEGGGRKQLGVKQGRRELQENAMVCTINYHQTQVGANDSFQSKLRSIQRRQLVI